MKRVISSLTQNINSNPITLKDPNFHIPEEDDDVYEHLLSGHEEVPFEVVRLIC
jgi:hypothetical protein